MKNRLILILIALLVVGATLGGVYFFAERKYKGYQAEKIEKENKAQVLAETQQKALEDAKSEIEKLKEQSESSQKRQAYLENKVQDEQKQQSSKELISSTEISRYLGGVMQIKCGDVSGSISLWKFSGNNSLTYAGITNAHVIESADGYCMLYHDATVTPKEGGSNAMASVNSQETYNWNNFTDVAILSIAEAFAIPEKCGNKCGSVPVSKDKLNYSIGTLSLCPTQMPAGAPVVTIGFPAFAMQENSYYGVTAVASHQILSNGIISGYNDQTLSGKRLPYNNYYVSAKIDSGNSGGIALSKTAQGLCVLGIPTWVSVGNYETNGVIQNIHNVMYKN